MKQTYYNQISLNLGSLLTIAGTALVLCIAASSTSAAKLYKWVDADGNISYQDQPPPGNAKIIKESELEDDNADPAATDEPDPVIVYTIEDCDSCEVLMLRLQQLAIPYVEQSLLSKDVQKEILSQSDSLSAPTLFFNNKYSNGLTDDELIAELKLGGFQPEQRPNQLEVFNPNDLLDDNEDDDVQTDEALNRE